jgi:hypothetical protein
LTEQELEKLKYPIGRMPEKSEFTSGEILANISVIEKFPALLRAAVTGLSDEQLNTPYREGGWTSRILVHHVGDSHMNAFMRCKLALTEEAPVIKPYFEDRWAGLADYSATPLEVSLALLEALHKRWVVLARSLSDEQMLRTYIHPEYNIEFSVARVLDLYAWHSNHHLAHITRLKERMGW